MLEDIVERIKQRLKATGLSPRAASIKAGLSPDGIRNLERALKNREAPGASTQTIAALARVLETTPAWLLDGSGPERARDSIDERLRLLAPDVSELLHGHFDALIDHEIGKSERKRQ